jgi:hypothetical protein
LCRLGRRVLAALAVVDADDRGHLIRKDRTQRRQVAGGVQHDLEQVADGGLILDLTWEKAWVRRLK